MGFSYNKLWKLLIDKNMSKTDLRNETGISQSTLYKLKKSENINTDVLEKICIALKCAVDDIMELDCKTDHKEYKQLSIYDFDKMENAVHNDIAQSVSLSKELKRQCISDDDLANVFRVFDKISTENVDALSGDDICTPMCCVKKMLDYIPKDFWNRKDIKVLDPCCGNGNFGAYCRTKTNDINIYYNDINEKRLQNCFDLLTPKHLNKSDFFCLQGEFDTKYDLIMANPPYSGGGNKNRSLSNRFIEHSIDLLNDRGFLCFITPNNWMTYNNNNSTLKKLLSLGSFVIIDNDAKRYFKGVGSSFVIFVWQKGIRSNKTKVVNNFLINDVQYDVEIPDNLPFIPLYLSNEVISCVQKAIGEDQNAFKYRCDLHNFTKKELLSDKKNEEFRYRTIHTARKTRYAKIKQDIYDKWIVVVPLSTYYLPYVEHNVNTTQSVGYVAFENKEEAESYVNKMTQPIYKVLVHLTRYGNFNNIMVLKHLKFDEQIVLTDSENQQISLLMEKIKY